MDGYNWICAKQVIILYISDKRMVDSNIRYTPYLGKTQLENTMTSHGNYTHKECLHAYLITLETREDPLPSTA